MEQGATSVGAAVPIRYAIAVLREKGIAWAAVPGKEGLAAGRGAGTGKF
jgi:hypothetical protein